MGEYKTLFRIRMRFYWPGMRKDIKLWVKMCGQCLAYDTWRNRKSEMYFSWPITTPFYIMHVDLWSPGKLVDDDGKTLQLMNCMCDLTQFVISIIVDDARSEILAKLFMEQVVLSFGMVAVVVVDADGKFLSLFEKMCSALGFIFWPLARGNHKGNSVEKYHRFLNNPKRSSAQIQEPTFHSLKIQKHHNTLGTAHPSMIPISPDLSQRLAVTSNFPWTSTYHQLLLSMILINQLYTPTCAMFPLIHNLLHPFYKC